MSKTNELLTRGVEQVLPSKESLSKLISEKRIRVYYGIDPTAPKLHLGHTIALRKLQKFADLGHEAILLFGTGTVLAGDPSQRDEARKKITDSEIQKNISTWKTQVKSFVDFKKLKVRSNAEWLLKLSLKEVLDIASKISAIQLIKRDMFQKRLDSGGTVWTNEILYPLLQGYDSVAMDVDLELGGTDQTFNMLVGRELQKKMAGREKYILSTKMILGTDGIQMSKSSGNCIWLEDNPEDVFGKTMSISDNQINSYIELLTELPLNLSDKIGPLEAKKKLAFDITTQIHGENMAKRAKDIFEKTFQLKTPEYNKRINIKKSLTYTIAPFTSLASISDAKRQISQRAVEVNGRIVTDLNFKLKEGDKIKIGSTIFGTAVEENK